MLLSSGARIANHRVSFIPCGGYVRDSHTVPLFPSEHHSIDAHETEFPLRLSALFTMSCILDLSDELLVMICQYALCPAQGLSLTGEPSFGFEECNVRCEDRKSIAAGLFLTNRRLSRIAIPIMYRENTFCFSIELRPIMEFFRSLPPKNLKQIKRIYLPDRLQPHAEGSIDGPLLSSATTFLTQTMSLKSFSIAVPRRMEMKIDRSSSYPHSNHGQLSVTALRMLQDGCLKEVRFVQNVVYSYLWEVEASVFGDDIVKDFVEHVLLDKETCEDLQKRRRSCINWRCRIPARKYDEEELEKTRATYRDMLIGIKSVWEDAGVTAERESSYLKTQRSTVVIRRWKKKES